MSSRPNPRDTARQGRYGPAAAALLAALLGLTGCGREEKGDYQSVTKPPTLGVIHPPVRTIVRTIGQPSFVEAYERTAIYPKLTAYVNNWVKDIGDRVKRDDVLATLFVPELVEEYRTKDSTVKLDQERVTLAQQVVKVAEANVKAARARLEEARQILGKYDAEVARWDSEVKRLRREVERNVVAPQILLESENQLKSNVAARDAARAAIDRAAAELKAAEETLAEDNVDVAVARAALAVATSEWKRVGAMVGYLTLRAPFDGIVYERNANSFDFVLPRMGDPTANRRSPDVSSGGAAPVYVVDRTDIVRVFMDIPERDANYVYGVDLVLLDSAKSPGELPEEGKALVVVARIEGGLHFRAFDAAGKRLLDAGERELAGGGTRLAELKSLLDNARAQQQVPPAGADSDGLWDRIPGRARQLSPILKGQVLEALAALLGREKVPLGTRTRVLIRAYRDQPIEGYVSRSSWALNVTSRTLRAEIDLPNPGSQLLPGMYAYAYAIVEHPGVRAVPTSALSYSGDQTYCWLYEDGLARRVEVRTGLSDGDWIEITSLTRPTAADTEPFWAPLAGAERVIVGDISTLADGDPVQLAPDADRPAGGPAPGGGRPTAAR